jgi:hypothetical protein
MQSISTWKPKDVALRISRDNFTWTSGEDGFQNALRSNVQKLSQTFEVCD